MNTFKEEWDLYKKAAYPNGFGSEQQERQIFQAFYSGAFAMIILWAEISDTPECEAVKELGKLENEIRQAIEDIVRVGKNRN